MRSSDFHHDCGSLQTKLKRFNESNILIKNLETGHRKSVHMLNTSCLISLCCVDLHIIICALSMCTDYINSLSFLNKPDINIFCSHQCVSVELWLWMMLLSVNTNVPEPINTVFANVQDMWLPFMAHHKQQHTR